MTGDPISRLNYLKVSIYLCLYLLSLPSKCCPHLNYLKVSLYICFIIEYKCN